MAAEVLGAVVLLSEDSWCCEDEDDEGGNLLIWEIDEKDEMTIERFKRWFSINCNDIVIMDLYLPQKKERWIWSRKRGWKKAITLHEAVNKILK